MRYLLLLPCFILIFIRASGQDMQLNESTTAKQKEHKGFSIGSQWTYLPLWMPPGAMIAYTHHQHKVGFNLVYGPVFDRMGWHLFYRHSLQNQRRVNFYWEGSITYFDLMTAIRNPSVSNTVTLTGGGGCRVNISKRFGLNMSAGAGIYFGHSTESVGIGPTIGGSFGLEYNLF